MTGAAQTWPDRSALTAIANAQRQPSRKLLRALLVSQPARDGEDAAWMFFKPSGRSRPMFAQINLEFAERFPCEGAA